MEFCAIGRARCDICPATAMESSPMYGFISACIDAELAGTALREGGGGRCALFGIAPVLYGICIQFDLWSTAIIMF